jgi:hypothetical protein
MIQRIQSLYLTVIVILLAFLIFFPIAELVRVSDESLFSFSLKGLQTDEGSVVQNFSAYPLSILFAVSLVITLLTIFLYKKRMLQIRLTVFNVITFLGLQGVMYYYVSFAESSMVGVVSYKLFFVFPTVCAVLAFLALRAIARDEALVRSLDRLR